MSSLQNRIESALRSLLEANAGVSALARNLYLGQSSDKFELDAIVCHAPDAREDPPGLGNYYVSVSVMVLTKASQNGPHDTEDRGAVHEAAVDAVEAALAPENLGELLTALHNDFFCYDPVLRTTNNREQPDDRMFRTEIDLLCYACKSDLD